MKPTKSPLRHAVLGSLALAVLLSAPGFGAESELPDFSGTWQLNRELSEDPREIMRQNRDRSRAGRSGGRGMGGRMGGRGPGSGARGDRGTGSGEMAAATLHIQHREPRFTVRAGERDERVFSTAESDRSSAEASIRPAKWKKGALLVTNHETPSGAGVRSIYELSLDGNRLSVTVEIEGQGPRPKLEFRRVYDRDETEGASASP